MNIERDLDFTEIEVIKYNFKQYFRNSYKPKTVFRICVGWKKIVSL